ncbi:hypothetical protein pb186bvf_020719 [Paramecium bursaria]
MQNVIRQLIPILRVSNTIFLSTKKNYEKNDKKNSNYSYLNSRRKQQIFKGTLKYQEH